MASTVFSTPINDLATTLASPRSVGAATLALASGAGAKITSALAELGYGAPSASKPLRVTLTKASYATRADASVIQATGLSGDTLTGCTVVEGTSDQAFAIGANVEVMPTAGTIDAIEVAVNALENATTQASVVANRVYAGPASGAAAAPGFRLVVAADMPVFVASGASHAAGAVPDPGVSAGTTKFLREDATWQVPAGGGGSPGGSSGQLEYNNAGAFGGTAAGSYATSGALFTFQAQAAADIPLVCKGTTSQSGNLQEWQDVTGAVKAKIDVNGTITGAFILATGSNGVGIGVSGAAGLWGNAIFQLPSSAVLYWANINASSGTKDVAIERQTTNTLKVNDGTAGTAINSNLGFLKGKLVHRTGAGAPAGTPIDGETYWDTTNFKLYVGAGGAWKSSAAFT